MIARRGILILSLLVRSALAEPGPSQEGDASQDASTRAKTLFDEGVEQGRLGHFDAALTAFEEAYRLAPHPIVLFNIGKAAEASGNHERAISAYEALLELDGDMLETNRRLEVSKSLQRLRKHNSASSHLPSILEQPQKSSVEVICPFPGFRILQGHSVIGKTPFSGVLELETKAPLSIERPGYLTNGFVIPTHGPGEPFRCEARLDPQTREPKGVLVLRTNATGVEVLVDGQQLEDRVSLPIGPHLIEVSTPGRGKSVRTISILPGKTLVLQAKVPPAKQSPTARRVWGFSLLGSGLAILGSGIAVLAVNEDRFRNWQAEAEVIRALPDNDATRAIQARTANALLSDIETVDVVAGVTLATAAVLVASGVTLLLIPDPGPRVSARAGDASLRVTF